MKALSIISLVASAISILLSISIMDISCYDSYGNGHYSYVGMGPGITSLFISLWFLAFSIVATVVSFKKKKIST